MRRQLIKYCDCEDFPCCLHADMPLEPTTIPEPDEWDNSDLVQCDDYQDRPQSECERNSCPHYKDCWGE